MRPGTLAKVLLHASLVRGAPPVSSRLEATQDALSRLDQLAAGLPSIDAVAIGRRAREELDHRVWR
jgi:hypothetical protein